MLLAILEGLLTDTDIEGLVDDNADRQVSKRGAGEPMVFGTSGTLIDALATFTNDRISEVAVRWAQAEEFGGTADPADLTRGLAQLVGLAREARRVDGRVYCWMSL